MKRLPFLLLTVLAAAAIVWTLFFGASGTAPEPREKPRAERTVTPERAPRRPAKLRIAGHVQTKDGTAIRGATVFVLDKKRRGASRDQVPHEISDGDGRWSLRTRTVFGSWIGVVAPGYRNAWLDGDHVDPAVQIFLVMERAPALEVTLTGPQGGPLTGQGLQLEPWPPGASWFLPGPRGRQGEQWKVTDEHGRATFRMGDDGPVRIRANLDGAHTEPRELWLPSARGRAALAARPNATLRLELRGPSADAAPAGVVTARFFDPAGGGARFALTQSTAEPGLLVLERAVAPGTYHVELELEGHGRCLLTDVAVAEGADVVARTAVLPPARAGASLTVRLVGNVGGLAGTQGGRRRAPLTFLRRVDDGGWARCGWIPGAPERWDRSTQQLVFAVPAGRYDLLVADVLTGRSMLERDVELAPSAARKLELRMQPGQRGRVPLLRTKDVYARALSVVSEEGARFPVFGGTRDGRVRTARALDVIGRALDGRDVWLGPYPCDGFTLTIERSDGTRADHAYP